MLLRLLTLSLTHYYSPLDGNRQNPWTVMLSRECCNGSCRCRNALTALEFLQCRFRIRCLSILLQSLAKLFKLELRHSSTGRRMHVSHQWATKNGTPGTPPRPASAMRSCVMWFVTDTFARHMTHDTRNTRRVPIPGMSGRAACRLSWAFPLFIISMLTHSVTLSAELELGGPGAWGDLGRQWGALCDVCHSLIRPHARGPAPAVRGLGHCVMRH